MSFDYLSSTIGGLLPLGIAASLPPEPSDTTQAVWWIVGAASAAVIFNQLVTAWNNLTGRFKEKEGAGPEYVSRVACHQAHDKLSVVLKEIDQQHERRTEALRLEQKKDMVGLHDKINTVAIITGEIRGTLKGLVPNE